MRLSGAVKLLLVLDASNVRVDYAVDEVRMRPVYHAADWKADANERIVKHRTNNITLRLSFRSHSLP